MPPTTLVYQHDAKKLALEATLLTVTSLDALDDADRALFKSYEDDKTDADLILTFDATIFHPQGGGQPSDQGLLTYGATAHATASVVHVRMDANNTGRALHLVRLHDPSTRSALSGGCPVHLVVDAPTRLLYSRLHTAGHVLGSAVSNLAHDKIPSFAELKASHFPGKASCEFQGSIASDFKDPIQTAVRSMLAQSCPVEIAFWSADDFRTHGLEAQIPDASLLPPGETRFRVVRIVGGSTYPCGGTHVDTVDQCGDVVVTKISRSKGQSRVSYKVSD